MSHLTGEARGRYVQDMFSRIAPRYNLINRLMTFGRDGAWRREAIGKLALEPGDRLLDLGSGTGDLAFEAQRQQPGAQVIAADFTEAMLRIGKESQDGGQIQWLIADALHLPFANEAFDGVVSGFLLRNVGDLEAGLREQHRLLRSGERAGRFVSLDTTPPRRNLLRPLIEFQLHTVIPTLGRFIAGDPEAYRYLPSSTEGFTDAEKLADQLRQTGFEAVGYVRRMLGTVAIHWGTKSTRPQSD